MDWTKVWTSRRKDSASTASRAESLLLHDTAGISPALLELIQNEIVQAVSRHMDVQHESVEVRLVKSGSGLRLTASLPLRAPGEGPPRKAGAHG